MPRQLQKYFHESLVDCVYPHTDAPINFLQWCCFSLIGGVMKRKFYIKQSVYRIMPNQYIILVGGPGVGKGTSLHFVWDLVRKGQPMLANVIPDRITTEKVIEMIAVGWGGAPKAMGQQLVMGPKDHTVTIFSPELKSLLKSTDEMMTFLVDVWDRSDYTYLTKNAGEAHISDMCTSMVGATVPEHIRNIDRAKDMSVKGGFSSRCLFIYSDRPPKRKNLQPLEDCPSSTRILNAIKNDLAYIASLPDGEYILSPEAKLSLENFMDQTDYHDLDTEAVSNFKSRRDTHVLKLAMVLAISRHDDRIIDKVDIDKAIGFVHKVMRDVDTVFEGVGDSDLALATSKVSKYLEAKGVASRKDLITALHRHMNPDVLDRVLYVLREMEFLSPVTSGRVQMYKINPHFGSSNGNGKVKP